MTKIKDFVKNYVPLWAIICLSLSLLSFIILLFSRINPKIAELVSGSVGKALRIGLSYITYIFPFSLAELMLILLPLAMTALIVAVCVVGNKSFSLRLIISLVAVLSLFYSLYVFTLGTGYHKLSIAEKMDIENTTPAEDELYDTLSILQSEIEALLPKIEFTEGGSSQVSLTAEEISRLLCVGYEKTAEKYPGLKLDIFSQRAKPVLLSQGMTYLELLGIYSYFTGECNVNVNYPDYTLPFSIAHEFAHSRGISRENEANFVAFLVCINSDDPYIRYSGYLNMYEYVASALGKTNKNRLKEAYATLDKRILGELAAYSDFFYSNRVELLAQLSDFVNDKYLKAQGTEGIVSYSLAVRLCVGYYKNEPVM